MRRSHVRTRRTTILTAGVAIGLAAGIGGCSSSTSASSATKFLASMSGSSEVPAVSTSAGGAASVELSGTSLTYSVSVTNLSGPPLFSHIHIGAPGTNGPVRFNFCGTSDTPACTATTSGVIASGTGATLAGGITIDSLMSAIRAGNAYVNVHTSANPGGEVRGWLFQNRG